MSLSLCIGLKFWRVPSRKIFAVKAKCVKASRKRPADSSSDSDEQTTPNKKAVIADDIHSIRASLDSLLSVDKNLNVPLGLRKLLTDHFKCSICQDTITPPAIFSRCCR